MTHTINDFKAGDRVYHISHNQFSTKTEMIVISIGTTIIYCRWLTHKGKKQQAEFYPFELEKVR